MRKTPIAQALTLGFSTLLLSACGGGGSDDPASPHITALQIGDLVLERPARPVDLSPQRAVEERVQEQTPPATSRPAPQPQAPATTHTSPAPAPAPSGSGAGTSPSPRPVQPVVAPAPSPAPTQGTQGQASPAPAPVPGGSGTSAGASPSPVQPVVAPASSPAPTQGTQGQATPAPAPRPAPGPSTDSGASSASPAATPAPAPVASLALDAATLATLPAQLGWTNCALKYPRPQAAPVSKAGADTYLSLQWHLENTGPLPGFPSMKAGEDLRVKPVWNAGLRGEGIRVAVLDDGLEVTHEDLWPNVVTGSRNYRTEAGMYGQSASSGGKVAGLHDFPMPCSNDDTHGTSVAGLIAARDGNGTGVSGVAPRAQLVGLNILASNFVADTLDALSRDLDRNHVYNNSWGSTDNGHLATPEPDWSSYNDTLRNGLKTGRNGLGAIYVFSGGNGAIQTDYSSLDGGVSAMGIVNVCATNAMGKRAPYSERGANLTVCAPSADATDDQQPEVTTTSVRNDYTHTFNGTSASAPMVSGVIALMLQANPKLTWRDVPLILARTARKVDEQDGGWRDYRSPLGNAQGLYDVLHYSHHYGFGVANADAAVQLARNWKSVGGSDTLKTCGPYTTTVNASIPETGIVTQQGADQTARSTKDNSQARTYFGALYQLSNTLDYQMAPANGLRSAVEIPAECDIRHIEHVDVKVTVTAADGQGTHPNTGDLQMALQSPLGTVSTLMLPHACTDLNTAAFGAPELLVERCGGLNNFTFGVRRHLEEPVASGNSRNWELVTADRVQGGEGQLKDWSIIFYGR